jgi:CubicO group peptidase (beta-lactamase class C family)
VSGGDSRVGPRDSVDLTTVGALVCRDHGAAPAVTVAASLEAGASVARGIGAYGALEPAGRPVTPLTPFDLASVTKPVVALALARLAKAARLDLREPLSSFLPELSDTPSAQVPIELFAAHRAGLEAHQQLYAPALRGHDVDREAAIRHAASARRADAAGSSIPVEGFAPVYSDMGYLLLGLALERRAGAPLDAVVRREVLEPLGLDERVGSSRQLRARSIDFDELVAPTEFAAFRGGIVRGLVHDENAWVLSGDGLSGHAGLFGDAESVLDLGVAILRALEGRSDWLGPSDLHPLVRPRPGGSLLAGFDGRSGETPSSGARLGPRTFGHLGFTGTSLWIDPDARFVGVLLSNRVHPSREDLRIRAARPAAYDAMFDALVRAS